MFDLLHTAPSTKARRGRLTTPHGVVDTPVFMSVGTQGSVKPVEPRELREHPRAPGKRACGIVQGGIDPHLREECARSLVSLKFDGSAIGGVSVGEPEPEMFRAVEITDPHLPADQPRYAMGLGTPAQMVELVARGIDMFDCVLPTRVARNGTAFTRKGSISIKGRAYNSDFRPIQEHCDCFACRTSP